MAHNPITFHNVGLSFPQKNCFEGFTCQIQYRNRIALIGQNGSGKSTLFKMLQGIIEPTQGFIHIPNSLTFGYVPQIIDNDEALSGGQRLNKSLSNALVVNPDILLLDEPTNHLDFKNRQSLMRNLKNYKGTLLIISHDPELLRTSVETFWHIDQGKIHIFSGRYDDYKKNIYHKQKTLEKEIVFLNQQKKESHISLMKEQTRAAKSREKGEKHIHQRKWPTIVSHAKADRANKTSHQKKTAIKNQKQDLVDQLSKLQQVEILKPTFSLSSADMSSKNIVSIHDGTCGYETALLHNIYMSLGVHDRMAIQGPNGAGKSSLFKSILGDPHLHKTGQWILPKREDIGYLDQHYHTLDPKKTVLESIIEIAPLWSHAEIRKHLNSFLFRKNEEINANVNTLSGGEKARLSLAQIAAKTPPLLMLDEITNNLDLKTRAHVIQVLQNYPGAIMVISHDIDFLKAIHINVFYDIKDCRLTMQS